MASYDILEFAVDVTRETLRGIAHTFAEPWRASAYCQSCGITSFSVPTSLLQRMADLNVGGGSATAETLRQVLELVDEFVAVAHDAPAGSGFGEIALDVHIRLLVPMLVHCVRQRWPRVYPFFVAVLFLDEKTRESYPQAMVTDRYHALWHDLWDKLAVDDPANHWPNYVAALWLPAIKLLHWLLGGHLYDDDHLSLQLAYGHEVRPAEATDAVEAVLARTATAVVWRQPEHVHVAADYADFTATVDDQALLTMTAAPLLGAPASGSTPARDPALQLRVTVPQLLEGRFGDIWKWKLSGGGVDVLLKRGVPSTAGTAPTMRAELRAETSQAWLTLGMDRTDDGRMTGFNLAGLQLAFGFGGNYLRASARIEKGVLRIGVPRRFAVLRAFLPEAFELTFDAGVEYDILAHKLAFDGGAGLDLQLPLRARIGSSSFGAEISGLRLAAHYRTVDGGHDLGIAATTAIAFRLGPVTATAEGMGASFTLRKAASGEGNLARIAHTDLDFVPPHGIGLTVDAKVIKGGGFLFYDAASKRYAGAVELALGKTFTLKGVGLIEPTAGGKTSLLALATLERPAGNPTFDITGIGAFVAVHRRGVPDEFKRGLARGDLADVLFPADPVGRAPQVVATLGRLFPAADDAHVFGLLLQFTFGGAAKLVVGELGLLGEFGPSISEPRHVYLLARARCELPGELKRFLSINVEAFGHYDIAKRDFELRLQLRNSKLFGGDLTGEGLVLYYKVPDDDVPALPAGEDDVFSDARAGKRQLFISLGGYHPEYRPPARAAVGQRLSLVVAKGDWLRIEASQYLALTPGAFHFGADLSATVRFGGFGVHGSLGFDAVIGFDWSFQIGIHAKVKLMLGSRTLAGASLKADLIGPGPTVLKGKVSISVLWWDISKSFNRELSSARGPAQAPPDVAALLRAAVQRPDSWQTGAVDGIALTRRARSAGVWASPTRPLRMAQTVVPLGLRIDRFGAARLPQARAFAITDVTVPGQDDAVHKRWVDGAFSRALYLELSEDEKLAAEGFEHYPSGFELAPDAIGLDTSAGVASPGDYDVIIVDSVRDTALAGARPPRPRVALSTALIEAAHSLSPLAPAAPAPAPLIAVVPRRFVAVDDQRGAVGTATSYALARQNAADARLTGKKAPRVARLDEVETP